MFFGCEDWIPAVAGMTDFALTIFVTPADAGVQADAGRGAEFFFRQ